MTDTPHTFHQVGITVRIVDSVRRLPSKACQKRVLMHLAEIRPEWHEAIEDAMLLADLVDA